MKELKYLNVLYITNDFIQENIKEYLNTNSKEFFSTDNLNDATSLLNKKEIDIVLSQHNDLKYFKELRRENKKIQIIILSKKISPQDLLEGTKIKLIKFLQIPVSDDILISSLKTCIQFYDSNKSNIITLKNNFTYDYYNEILIQNEKMISLSKKEKDFFTFMLIRANQTVTYEEISQHVWQGCMSHDALRSSIKELRRKTYKELIKNISGIGYRFNLN